MKSFDGREKSILCADTRDILPSSISERVKSPYLSMQDPAYERTLHIKMARIAKDPGAPVMQLLDRKLVDQILDRKLGTVSPMYDRMGLS